MASFVDEIQIQVKAGDGGDGYVSFHREKYVQNGGPDGGDGGRGGDIVFRARGNMSTLIDFRYRHRFFADPGENGRNSNQTGASAAPLVIDVPTGTLVKEADTGRVLADMSAEGEQKIVFHGGRGGYGNARFASSVRQSPNFAKPGQKTVAHELKLELKTIADVGLVGFPNAGKSTILSILSAARPKIADYPFTTLVPNLGVVRAGNDGFVLADIPGLIEGASEGAGLGHDFLKHVERTRLLLHVVDAAGVDGRDPVEDLRVINAELENYGDLGKRPQIVLCNKTDLEEARENAERIRQACGGARVFEVSAATNKGFAPVLRAVMDMLAELPKHAGYEDEAADETLLVSGAAFTVERENESYLVKGETVERLLMSTNFSDPDSIAWFQRALRKFGIIDALRAKGAAEGDTVRLLDVEFDFVD